MTRTTAALLAALALCAGTSRAAPPLPATAVAEFREVNQTYTVDAFIEAVHQSTVSAQAPGRVVEINAEVGAAVRKGQVLMRLDARELSQQALGSQAQLEREQTNFDNARRRHEQAKALHAQKFISQTALEAAQADFDMAQAQLRATQASLNATQTTRDFATIVAPADQVISARHIELGEMAVPGKPLITGFDPNVLRAVAGVTHDQVGAVRRSRSVQIELPSLQKTVEVRAITWLPTADDRAFALRVRLDLPPGMQGVHPGTLARAHFVVGRVKKLVVPENAVLRRGDNVAVYVIDEHGTPRPKQARLGKTTGDGAVEVLAGVSAGDKVVLDPVKAGVLADVK